MSETGRLWSQGIKVPAIFPAGTELGWAASVPQKSQGRRCLYLEAPRRQLWSPREPQGLDLISSHHPRGQSQGL